MASITSIEHVGIGTVLSAHNLRVPIYQRSFSWEVEQITELLDDVQAAIDAHDEEYFLGSMVLTEEPDKKRPSVVDGQQRLVAVSMIYAAIRDYFELQGDLDNRERAAHLENKYLMARDLRSRDIEPKLRLNTQDASFFEGHVLARPGSADRKRTTSGSSSNKLIEQAYQIIRQRIDPTGTSAKSDAVNELIKWAEFLSDYVKVIVVKVSTEANAFQIFETLNDRGLDLSIADLLKNYVFGQAGEDKLEQVQSDWQLAMGRIGGDAGPQAITTFIRHFWASKHGLTRERQLYQKLKENINGPKEAVAFTADLAQAAQHYAALLNSDHEFWAQFGSAARRNVSTLLMLRMEQYRPLLLACMATLPANEIPKVLGLLISWSVRFRITHKLGSSLLENFYGSTGKLVREKTLTSAAALVRHAVDTVPGDQEFETAFATAKVEQSSLARYYLRTIERTMARELGKDEHEVISDEQHVNLEHVLPVAPKLKDWPKFDRESAEIYQQRIGNMALLIASKNTRLGNKPFAEKRKVFQESSIVTTKSIAERHGWSADAINERQKDLARVAVRAWTGKV